MPLYFTKPRRWPPSKPVQYALSALAVCAAVAVLIVWLVFDFGNNNAAPDTPTLHPTDDSPLPDKSYCLIIIKDKGWERFALLEANPTGASVTVTPLSPKLNTTNETLSTVLQKQGPVGVVNTVADTLTIPVQHYLSFSISDVENLFNKLGNNLRFTLTEPVTYKDENGANVHLAAETLQLTPKQIAALLHYDQWKDTRCYDALAAELTCAAVNQCLRANAPLKGYFELLSNTGSTDWRIDHFNAYHNGLSHLAELNEGTLAHIGTYTESINTRS